MRVERPIFTSRNLPAENKVYIVRFDTASLFAADGTVRRSASVGVSDVVSGGTVLAMFRPPELSGPRPATRPATSHPL